MSNKSEFFQEQFNKPKRSFNELLPEAKRIEEKIKNDIVLLEDVLREMRQVECSLIYKHNIDLMSIDLI